MMGHIRDFSLPVSSRRVEGVELELEVEVRSSGKNVNATEQMARPSAMNGTERSRILRRPRRSMKWKAMRVKKKFVRAMERDVSVGEWKERREKMVAEKYIREFWKWVG